MRTGRVESVWLERRGTQLTAAAPEGAQVLSVAFTGDFDEDGGRLYHVPSGVVYDYSSFDANAETITLASPLPVGESFDDGDALRVYPLADDAYAHVRLEDVASDEEPITARIDHALRGLLPEGQRETGAGEVATVENTGLEWVVRDVVGAGTVTIRANLESDTYEAGVSGWRLDRSGSAELNDISARGRLRTEEGGSYAELDVRADSGMLLLGLTANASPSFAAYADPDLVTMNQVGDSTTGENYIEWHRNTSLGTGLLMFGSAPGSTTFRGVFLNAADGRLYYAKSVLGTWELEQWNQLNLLNGWTWETSNWRPRYKMSVEGNTVKLIGGCSGGTVTNGTVLATLPSDYIPDYDCRIPIMSNAGSLPRLVVRGTNGAGTPGNIELFGLAAGASISLDGCEYRLK